MVAVTQGLLQEVGFYKIRRSRSQICTAYKHALLIKLVWHLCTTAMTISYNFVQKTYYDILGVQEDASHEQIRSAYRSAILDCHPDKMLKVSTTSEHKSGKAFIDIQGAWEILGDPQSRSTYDCKLETLRLKSLMSSDVNLEDLAVEDDDVVITFQLIR